LIEDVNGAEMVVPECGANVGWDEYWDLKNIPDRYNLKLSVNEMAGLDEGKRSF